MTKPHDLSLELPMVIHNKVVTTTTKVWDVLVASKNGDLATVKKLVADCPELIYAQYNYTPPIHFAVREGHVDLVNYLLSNGAHNPSYRIYPFQDSLQTMANDRGHSAIEASLHEYASLPTSRHIYTGDNGEIKYFRTPSMVEFEKAVDEEDLNKTRQLLEAHPEYALDETFFWGEGILTFAVKENNHKMTELLLSYGAKIPPVLKWAQFYYFEHLNGAAYIMKMGMDPNTKSWQEVTLLHDMAQKGFLEKADLLVSYGAALDAVDDEYRSTPLGMAARWGRTAMVEYLIKKGADVNKSGAPWATPLRWAERKGFTHIETILKNAGAYA